MSRLFKADILQLTFVIVHQTIFNGVIFIPLCLTVIACQTSSYWLVNIDKHIPSFVFINFELTINKSLNIIFSLHKFALHYPLINFFKRSRYEEMIKICLHSVNMNKQQCERNIYKVW